MSSCWPSEITQSIISNRRVLALFFIDIIRIKSLLPRKLYKMCWLLKEDYRFHFGILNFEILFSRNGVYPKGGALICPGLELVDGLCLELNPNLDPSLRSILPEFLYCQGNDAYVHGEYPYIRLIKNRTSQHCLKLWRVRFIWSICGTDVAHV